MNTPALYQPATPAMIVGRATSRAMPPLGLGEPFALRGGDRLGPGGIPFTIMHEWQPAFLEAVTAACEALLAAERPWFRLPPTMLVGPEGAGRTHAARMLARAAGVPHCILNLSDPVIAASMTASGAINEALWVSPVVAAMAATRCANPVVSVIGAELNDDAAMALVGMIDPVLGRAWQEDLLGTSVDLGEVSWIVQAPSSDDIPRPLLTLLDVVPMTWPAVRGLFSLSILLEVLTDLGIDVSDPSIGDLPAYLRTHWRSPKQAYAGLRTAVIDAHYAIATEGLPDAAPWTRLSSR